MHFCAAALTYDTAASSCAFKLAGGKHDRNLAPGAGNKVARRLLGEDFQVAAWNRDTAKAEALRDAGVSAQETPAAAVQQADVVVLMLADAQSINEVLLSEGVTPAMKDKTVVQMGTIGEPCRELFACSDSASFQSSLFMLSGPNESRQLSFKLHEAGALYLEAPVLGSQPGGGRTVWHCACYIFQHDLSGSS